MTNQRQQNANGAIYDVDQRPPFWTGLALSFQHLFSMFGATILVPLLVGLNPGVALFSSGVGTLLHMLSTRGKVPAYLGSSFAFIIPMAALLKTSGYPAVGQGVMAVGFVYLVLAAVIHFYGTAWINQVFPPAVVGPIIMVIGLSLAQTAASSATTVHGQYDGKVFAVAAITVLATIVANIYLSGFLGLMPVLLGIIVGYLAALLFGLVDLTPVGQAHWFAWPHFQSIVGGPHQNWTFYPVAMLTMAPLAIVTLSEHLGHLLVLSKITDRDLFANPGLQSTLAGDGLASVAAGLIGGPAVTSYGENVGVLQLSRVYSIWVIGGAACLAMILAFIGKVAALIQSVPGAVTGGVGLVLYGVIAVAGLQVLIDNQVNYSEKRNLMIAAPVLVIGIGNFHWQVSSQLDFSGLALATVLAVVLQLILPAKARSEA
ncbi:solute carrier family 23 protein [Leuconostocaceae bacterium ESL0958]|nr:solute carrier family 23 protein [Leuconostocaceae bacterium ESL0958]